MKQKQQAKSTIKKPLYLLSVAELIVGTILFIVSFFVSAYNDGYFLTYLGFGIMQAGMYTFGIGLVIMLLEEYGNKGESLQR